MKAQVKDEIIQQIKHDDLQADPDQPRTYFDKEGLNELADDIAVRGIMEPVLYFVDKNSKKTILAGERRWRAAKIAGLETVPCLYRESTSDIDRLLDQVSENFQREGLNPIEMAHFFEQMIEKHKIKSSELGEYLVKHGFKNFDRSYITNIRRLLKLPKWAKLQIQKNELTGAHGKYLLPAIKSKTVLKQLQAFLKKPRTTAELQKELEEAYEDLHIDASSGKYYFDENNIRQWQQTKFDVKKACKGCDTCQIIKAQFTTSLYCLNESCYDEKQQVAKNKIQKAKERKEKAADKKHEEELIERAEQLGVSVEEVKENDANNDVPENNPRSQKRTERTQEHLDEWLRKQIDTHLLEDESTRYQIILWMAAGKPGDFGGSARVDLDYELEEHGIGITLKNKIDPIQLELMTCTVGINRMERHNLRQLAHHIGIVLTGCYEIDSQYLDLKTKDELINSTPEAVIQAWDDGHWEKLCKKSAGFLKENILNMAHVYGVPEDLQQMYNEEEAEV